MSGWKPILAWALLAAFAAGCSRPPPAADPAAAAAPVARTRVVLQTDWFPQAEQGGFYQALARGFYAEAGIDVEIWSGGPGAGIKLKVARGDADFGMQRCDDVMVAVGQGMPLVMVMATLQHDPLALMVHADSPVRTVGDLAGRVVIGNVGMAWMPFLERRQGIAFEKRQNTYGLGEFLAEPDTIQQCMITNEPFFAEQQGRKVRTLPLAEAGYDCYHVVVARRELVRDAPAVVRAFVGASIRGWRDYLEGEPGPAEQLIRRRNPQATAELLAYSRRELRDRGFVRGDPARGEDVGQLAPARLEEIARQLLALEVLEKPLAVSAMATTAFLPPPADR